MKKEYLSIKKDTETLTIIEKSKFICTAKRVNNEDDAKNFVSQIKKKYPDATHNCYAYVADSDGIYARFSDDGEPSGTAGLPMLDCLKNNGVFCTAVVVTRYFGGVKLGTGGLVRAYTDCVNKTLREAGLSKNVLSAVLKTTVNYNTYSQVLKFLETITHVKKGVEFLSDGVELTFAVPVDFIDTVKDKIRDYSSGKSTVLQIETEYVGY